MVVMFCKRKQKKGLFRQFQNVERPFGSTDRREQEYTTKDVTGSVCVRRSKQYLCTLLNLFSPRKRTVLTRINKNQTLYLFTKTTFKLSFFSVFIQKFVGLLKYREIVFSPSTYTQFSSI